MMYVLWALLALLLAANHATSDVAIRRNLGMKALTEAFIMSYSQSPVNSALRAEQNLRYSLDGNAHTNSMLGFAVYLQDRQEEAIDIWRQSHVEPARQLLIPAQHAQLMARPAVALKWVQEAVSLDPNLSEAWRAIGDLEKSRNRSEVAASAYRKGWLLGDAQSGHSLASLLAGNGDPQSAAEIWAMLVNDFPNHPLQLEWTRRLVNSLRATEEFHVARELAEIAIEEYQDDAFLHMELGMLIYATEHDPIRAFEEIDTAINLDGSLSQAYAAKGSILAAERMYEEASEWYSVALQLDPDKESWHLSRALAARAAGDLDAAERYFRETLTLYPTSLGAYHGLARTLQALERIPEAIEAMNKVVELSGGINSRHIVAVGLLYEELGDAEQALKAYEQALEVNSDDTTAQDGLRRLKQ